MPYTDKQLRKLSPRHYALMREFIAGTPNSTIKKIYGISDSRLSIIKNHPRFKEEMDAMRKEVGERFMDNEANRPASLAQARELIEKEVYDSVKEIISLRNNSPADEIRLRSSMQILDRAGLVKVEKVRVESRMDVSDNLVFALGLKGKEDGGTNTPTGK